MRKILCWLGLHEKIFSQQSYPVDNRRIIDEVKYMCKCAHCGHVTDYDHWVWDGEQFVDADPNKHSLKLDYEKGV